MEEVNVGESLSCSPVYVADEVGMDAPATLRDLGIGLPSAVSANMDEV